MRERMTTVEAVEWCRFMCVTIEFEAAPYETSEGHGISTGRVNIKFQLANGNVELFGPSFEEVVTQAAQFDEVTMNTERQR